MLTLLLVTQINLYTVQAKEVKQDSTVENINICTIGDVDEQLIKKINEAYLMIPNNVRQNYEENGWAVYVTTENLGQKYFGRKMSILALTVTEEKAIYIDDHEKAARSVIHEMGHYIDYSFGFISSTDEFSSIFREEAEKFRSIHYTHINNTCTELEYFAESYLVMITEPDILIEYCPKTYEFLKKYSYAL